MFGVLWPSLWQFLNGQFLHPKEGEGVKSWVLNSSGIAVFFAFFWFRCTPLLKEMHFLSTQGLLAHGQVRSERLNFVVNTAL